MARCLHENAEHLMPGECIATMDGIVFVDPALCEQFRCLDCRAWLSMGESNDDGEAVAIEIRAAELALAIDGGGYPYFGKMGFDGAEVAGWIECESMSNKQPMQFGEWCGWLAREICADRFHAAVSR